MTSSWTNSRAAAVRRAAFTLVELMGVTAILVILMGFTASAVYGARQRAYTASANAEAQQIAAAFKSYWVAEHKWPAGFGNGLTALTKSGCKGLIDAGYLSIPESRWEDGVDGTPEAFCDPWGHPYMVKLANPEDLNVIDAVAYEGVASFPNQFRRYNIGIAISRPGPNGKDDDGPAGGGNGPTGSGYDE